MEAKCEQEIDLSSEEEDFINSCRDLDALAPDYDKKAAALFDTIQNAVEANGRLFYMVAEGLKTVMDARRDEVQALNEEHTEQVSFIQDRQAKISELERQIVELASNDGRVKDLEAMLEISEAERALLEKKLALAGRRQVDSGEGTELYSKNQELMMLVEQYQVKNQELMLLVEQYQAKNQELSLTLEQVHSRSQESQSVATQLQMAYTNAMAENAQLQQTLQGARQQVASFIQHTPPQDRNKLLLELATARSESMKLKEKLESVEMESSEKLKSAERDFKEKLESAERDFKERREQAEQELRVTKERLDRSEVLCELLKQKFLSKDEDSKDVAEIERLKQELASLEKTKAEEISTLEKKNAEELSSMAERMRLESAEQARFHSLKAEKSMSDLKRAHEAELANFRSQKAWAKISELQALADQLKEEVELHKRKRDEAAGEAKAAKALQRQQEDELFKTTKIMAEQDKKIAELEVKAFIREEEKPCAKQSEPKAKNQKSEPDLQKKVDTLSAERASLHSKLAKAEAGEQRRAKEVKDLKDELEMTNQKVKNLEQVIEDHPKIVAKLNTHLEALRAELATKAAALKGLDMANEANEKLKALLAARSDPDEREEQIAILTHDVAQLKSSLESNQATLLSLERYSCVQIAQVFCAGLCLLSAFRGQQVMPALVFGFLDKEFPDHFGVIKKKLHESKDRQQRFLDYVFGPRKDGPQEIATFRRIMKILDLIQAKGAFNWTTGPSEMMTERLSNHTKMVIDLMVQEKISANMNLDLLHEVNENVKMQLFYFAIKGKDKIQARRAEQQRALEQSSRLIDEIDAMEQRAIWTDPNSQRMREIFSEVSDRIDQFSPQEFKSVEKKLDENFHEGFMELAKTIAKKGKTKKGEKDPFVELQEQNLLTTFSRDPILEMYEKQARSKTQPKIQVLEEEPKPTVKVFYVDPENAAETLKKIEQREALGKVDQLISQTDQLIQEGEDALAKQGQLIQEGEDALAKQKLTVKEGHRLLHDYVAEGDECIDESDELLAELKFDLQDEDAPLLDYEVKGKKALLLRKPNGKVAIFTRGDSASTKKANLQSLLKKKK